jgi:nitrogen-specific signal transduction histidine kinase/CheY-like chemotaxis protein
MKPDVSFVLEQATWPALLVERDGTIRRANPAAALLFGDALRVRAPKLDALWAAGNPLTPQQLIGRTGGEFPGVEPITLKLPQGEAQPFRARLCEVTRAGHTYCLVQLDDAAGGSLVVVRPPPPPAPSPPPPAPTPAPLLPQPNPPSAEALPPPRAGHPTPAGTGHPEPDHGTAQKQKLECALQLAQTVALDFNNVLTSILGHVSLVLSKMEPQNPWRDSLLEIEKSAERAAEIAYDLAAFSRQEKETADKQAGNLNDLLRRTVNLFQQSAGKTGWTLELEHQVYAVRFDEAKIQQAFVKIIENAVQALGANGQIRVRSRNVTFSEATKDGTTQIPAGAYVCVEIVDNGEGIAPAVLPRIFEPFFTTRKAPQHRGLGLAWVYGIVTNHGGSVAVSSRLGQGTEVRIYLPAQRRVVQDRQFKAEELTGNQTILMVDDEELVLTLGQTILSSFGYRVLTANGGAKALEILASSRETIHLVITDLVMPGMSGRELVERIKAQAPQVKVVCTSGYVRSANGGEEDASFLRKPFTSQALLRKVKQALE